MENELHKAREKILQLEAQYTKLEIKYDEERYNKQWISSNYEKEEL